MSTLEPSDRDAAQRFLTSSTEALRAYLDPAHHTFVDLYLGRADCLHALGDVPPIDVLRELAGAARCFAAHAGMYLERWPVTRIRSRRLVPLELAAVVADPEIIAPLASVVAMDTVSALAGVEDDATTREIRELVGGGLDASPGDRYAMAGLLATLYWASLSAVVSGDALALRAVSARGRDVLDGADWLAEVEGGIGRLVACHRAFTALLSRDPAAFALAWADHVQRVVVDPPSSAPLFAEAAPPCAGALDRTSLALVAAAQATGLEPLEALRSLPEDPTRAALLPYVELMTGA